MQQTHMSSVPYKQQYPCNKDKHNKLALSTSEADARPEVGKRIWCGVVSGVVQSGTLNPWDRALYLSVKHSRPFLLWANFSRPYEGFFQTITQVFDFDFTASLYFPAEDAAKELVDRMYPKRLPGGNVIAGFIAGAFNGFLLNPASAVKYQYWGSDKEHFIGTAREMIAKGGIRPFFKGIRLSTADSAITRTDTMQFGMNMLAAMVATVVSSPWNYIRNMQYASLPAHRSPRAEEVIRQLLSEASAQPSRWKALRLVQERLRVGLGTLRVAVGMAIGAEVYAFCRQHT